MEDDDIPPESPSPQSSLTSFYSTQPQLTSFSHNTHPVSMQHQQQLQPQEQCLPQSLMQTSGHLQQVTLDSNFNCWLDPYLSTTQEDTDFSLQFCKWFYLMLNNLNNYNTTSNFNTNNLNNNTNNLTPQHFFQDCRMLLLTDEHHNKNIEALQGSEAVCDKLRRLSCNFNYNPNLSSQGLQTLSDRFGRRAIVVAGTLHSGDHVGLFEQQFGLLRDSGAEYNWKIKSMRLALSSHTPQQHICLQNTKLIFSLQPPS